MLVMVYIIAIISIVYIGCSMGYYMLSINIPYLKYTKSLCWHIPIIATYCSVCCFVDLWKAYGVRLAIHSLFIGSKLLLTGGVLAKMTHDYLETHPGVNIASIKFRLKMVPTSLYRNIYREKVIKQLNYV